MKYKNNLHIKNKTFSPILCKSQKGFTLLETLVAIFILTLSMTGPVYIASVGFRNTIDSRDNISAQYIAEEVIEVIKNKRDNLSMKESVGLTVDWFKNLVGANNDDCINESGSSAKKCYMESDADSTSTYIFTSCAENGCPNISFNPVGNFNVYGEENQSSLSKFVREFYIEKETGTNLVQSSVKLIVNIKWNDKGRDKIYSLTQRLYDVRYLETFNPN